MIYAIKPANIKVYRYCARTKFYIQMKVSQMHFYSNIRRMKNIYSIIISATAYICIFIFSIFLFLNYSYFSVPNTDIFQYIDDGRMFIQLKLPQNIQVPPLFSLLISIGARLFHQISNPEIFTAHMINITSSIILLCVTYGFLQIYSSMAALSVLVLLMTNPHFVFSTLDVNTEVFFSTMVVSAFFALQKSHIKIALLLAGISYFIRYEGLLLFLILLAFTIPKKKHIYSFFITVILILIPVITWFFISTFHNHISTPLGNGYVKEVIEQLHRLPQFGLITQLFRIMADYLDTNTKNFQYVYFIEQGIFYLLIIVGIVQALRYLHTSIKGSFAFALLYLFSHIFFPYSPDRYILPVLGCLYFAIIVGYKSLTASFISKHTYIYIILISFGYICIGLLSYSNFIRTRGYYNNSQITDTAYPRYYRHEILLASEWINKQNFSEPIIVITYEPWILGYYSINRLVSFPFFGYENYKKCDSITCLINEYIEPNSRQKQRILFIQQSNSLLVDETFPSAGNFNVNMFNKFPYPHEKNNFLLLTHISYLDSWVNIYEFKPIQ